MVARICEQLGVPHAILTARMAGSPRPRSRSGRVASAIGCSAFGPRSAGSTRSPPPTMPTTRPKPCSCVSPAASGVRGLAGNARPRSVSPGAACPPAPPAARLAPRRARADLRRCRARARPPTRAIEDEQFERVRVRRALAAPTGSIPSAVRPAPPTSPTPTPPSIGRSKQEWARARPRKARQHHLSALATCRAKSSAASSPARFAGSRPKATPIRAAVSSTAWSRRSADGGTATLRGVLCRGGAEWHFVPAPNRTRPVDKF